MDYEYAVIGGDKRQVYLADELVSRGHSVISFGLECTADRAAFWEIAAGSSEYIICPVPITSDFSVFESKLANTDVIIRMLVNQLHPGQHLIAGCISPQLKSELTAKDVSVYDLMKNENLAIYNSIATAEGALCEAIKESPVNLCKSRCAVLGYGRCGRAIANRLSGMHCITDIYSNDSRELAMAGSFGYCCRTISDFGQNAAVYDFIFNTVPSGIITSDIIRMLNKNTTIIDIASGGGTDFNAAGIAGINAHLYPGLPGKYAPMSSGIMLAGIIDSLTSECSNL